MCKKNIAFKPIYFFYFFSFFLPGYSYNAKAQQLPITDFVLFGGNGTCPGTGQTPPQLPGCGVQLGSSTNIQGGAIGSFRLVKSTGNTTLNTNIHSGGTVQLANSNTVTGKITAANNAGLGGTILSVGSSANLGGNIDVNGNIVIGGGTVTGKVTHPSGTTYSGPAPAGGNITGPLSLPILPAMPAINTFPTIPTNAINISNNKTITPDSIYGNVTLGGNKTLTFNGTGVYIFRSIKNSGTTNKFVFDFKGDTTGIIKILVLGDVDLNKVLATIKSGSGGSASRIYLETQGIGSTSSNGTVAFNIANGSAGSTSKWLGSVWAPFGAITIGAGTGSSDLLGALWSGTQVNILSGVSVTYSPLVNDNVINPFNPITGFKFSTVIGAELTSLTQNISEEAKKLLVILNGYVLIDVIAIVGKETEVYNYLTNNGMPVSSIIPNGSNTLITTGMFPITNLLELNNQGAIINFCRPVYAPLGNSGLIQNAGDKAIGSDLVRNGYDLQGEGIKIGVISDSYNSQVTPTSNPAELDISTGEIPGAGNPVNSTPVQVLLDYPYFARSDEGRAMLQIVHDIAPKATLAFRTGFISPGDFAVGIKQMQEAGCKVIVDDLTFINEPFLEDGPVAKMVDLVKSLGVSYFTSAGNFSNKSHEQNYRPVAAPAGLPAGTTAHDFSGTGDIYQRIKLKPGSYTIALQWEDSIYSVGETHTGTKNDFDLYLTDLSGNIICGYNRDNTLNVGGDPFEFLAYTVASTVTEIDANLLITRANAGTPAPRFKYIIFRGDAVISEYQTGGSTIVGQANANGAITVAAINYFKTPAYTPATPVIAPYSSIGGTKIRAIDRNKPDITAPDGVNTSVNMGPDYSGDPDPFSNFFGTSAAAPHAAATAALLIEGRKRFLLEENVSPDVIKNLLQANALNVGAANAAGAGLIQADIAMRTFASPKPSLISIAYPSNITASSPPTSSFTLTVNGDYLTDASVVLFRGVAIPTNFVNTTQLTAIIPAFTGNPSIQVYTAPLANGDGGYSNTILFFSIAKKAIKIIGDSKTKKYGEQLPAFTSTILVNDIPLAQTSPLLTLADIGLQNLSYATNATPMSNVGNQYFIKPVRTFDLTNSTDVGLLEIYTYDTIPGILTIQKLPVQVIPNDKTLTYGEPIGAITFTYQYDAAIAAANPAVQDMIRLSHELLLSTDVIGLVNNQPVALSNGQPVALSNGQPIALSNGQPVALSNGQYVPIANAQSVTGFETGFATIVPYQLSNTELANISFLVSNQSLLNARTLSSSTKVVDLAQQAILGYNSNPSLTTMVNVIPQVNTRGVLGAAPLANGQPVALSNGQPVALSNGQPVALSNGQPVALSNGQPIALSNGQPIALSNSFSAQANRIPVIIDQVDVANDAQAQGIIIKSLNLITGLTSGIHKIIPGTLLNDNFEITYGLGKLTINPAPLTVKANDVTRPYGEINPTLTATYTGFKYAENLGTSDIKGTVSLTTTALQTSNIGTYPIVASAGTLASNNYSLNFANGIFTIVNNPCLLTRNPFTNFGSTSNPGTATSLWLNIEAKISGQLNENGKYLYYTGSSVSFNNITSTPTISNMPIPNGKIIADNTVTVPISNFDAGSNTWITKVPVGFASTSDIFISGVIINSSKGFVKKNNANSIVKGIFYSNTAYSDQWTYGIAAYQPQFDYSAISAAGQVTSINGNYRAGTPTTQLANLVNGGSGGGGNNYTGSTSSYDNFTACCTGTTTACPAGSNFVSAQKQNSFTDGMENFQELLFEGELRIIPNPASNVINISFAPASRGGSRISLFTIDGKKVFETENTFCEKGKYYFKKIDVSKLINGIYLVKLECADKMTIKKIIINH